jgi:hypothetical protein
VVMALARVNGGRPPEGHRGHQRGGEESASHIEEG